MEVWVVLVIDEGVMYDEMLEIDVDIIEFVVIWGINLVMSFYVSK